MKFSTLLLLVVALIFAACNGGYTKTSNGVIISTKDGKENVRLEVVSAKIVRVSATPNAEFSTRASLIVLDQQPFTDYTVADNDESVVVTTAELVVTVNKATGEVVFADTEGNVILAEKQGGGREYAEFDDSGEAALSVRQVWQSDDDEAIYGLGQHQADEFNYKGKNEELFQYNTKISIPFFVSSKNYGVLWDNYSLSRYGNSKDYMQLNEAFTCYDKDGNQGGVTGTYKYGNKVQLERVEPFVYFENLKANREFMPKEVDFSRANVTFEGYIEPRESGEYKFILYYSGYVKVFMDDQPVVVERWRTAWNPNSYKFGREMKAGERQKLRIEWIPDGGEAYCGLRALEPVDQAVQDQIAMWSEVADQVDYYFVKGVDADEVISGYRTLTGKAQVMPKWVMGYWQSREKYNTQEEIVGVVKDFRAKQFPLDNIVQDWNYWQLDSWGAHDFDTARFSNPQQMLDDIHSMNTHYMISVWPKFYVTTEHYKEFDAQGWMYQQAVVDSIYDWLGFMGSFYDAYSPGARDLFWKQMNEHLFKFGVDAWWMDASEPNVRDCTDTEYRKALCGPTALGSSARYFNTYSIVNADAIYNGQRSVVPNQRVFLLTRSGFAGLQRYSTASWSGDIATRWEDMKAQISAGINYALSGVPFWTMDAGGFCVEKRYEEGQRYFDKTGKENADNTEWRELNTRWFQFGAFCPLFRTHGQWPLREPWNVAPESHAAFKSMRYYTELRYQLMPYIYSLNGMVHFNDYTIMRGLIMDFGQDSDVKNVGDQYMFGPSIMVAPVYTYKAREREVYFPANTAWYDFYTGERLEGGATRTVAAPYERMPLFVREGAIIPCGPTLQYASQNDGGDMTIYVYAGKDSQFTIYEDEGTNYDYENGAYSTIALTYDEATKTLVINERKGSFEQMKSERVFNVVYISKDNAHGFDPLCEGQKISYNGEAQIVKF